MYADEELMSGIIGLERCLWCWRVPELEVESHQPKTPAAQTRRRAAKLKRQVWIVEVGLSTSAAGGSVGRGGARSGVAGERCVPSTARRCEWKDDIEPLRRRSASPGVSVAGFRVPSGVNKRGEFSVASSSARGCTAAGFVGASERVKPR